MSFFQAESLLTGGASSASLVCDQLESKPSRGIPTVFIVDRDHAACESLAILITREGWHGAGTAGHALPTFNCVFARNPLTMSSRSE